jgi:hypothetical protein
MASPILESTDVVLGSLSLLSSFVATCGVLASPEKNLSENMLIIAQFTKSHIPHSLLPTLPFNTNRIIQLGILFAGLTAFWVTQMVLYFRRGRSPADMSPPFVLSIIALLLAKFNLAEYLLVCLPTFLGTWEVAILATWYSRSRNQRKGLIPGYSKEKPTVDS